MDVWCAAIRVVQLNGISNSLVAPVRRNGWSYPDISTKTIDSGVGVDPKPIEVAGAVELEQQDDSAPDQSCVVDRRRLCLGHFNRDGFASHD